ncbi:MAG: hypothetical protein Q4G67_15440, partial [Actinomycetia bacterium]|nr:hypothetical protein [Actinomycetes bacterium]
MDRNYAAPKAPKASDRAPDRHSAQSAAPAESPNRGSVLLVLFAGALALQAYALYSSSPGAGLAIPHGDKLVHAAIFAAPALLGTLAGLRRWWLVLLLGLHAPLSEWIQHVFLPTRSGEVLDIVADWVGIGIGLFAGHVIRSGRARRYR